MNFQEIRIKFFAALGLTMSLVLVVPLLVSCGGGGSSSYAPVPTAAQQQVMITPQTLNSWVIGGYGTDSLGYNKLVILDVDSAANDRIPGSYNHDTGDDLKATRSNGVSYTISQVPTKEAMDALIQRTGIDAHTVIALVGNGTLMNVGRAYFNFRYWGFPKERLRVLNGTKNATYRDAAGYPLTSAVTPLPTPSTYSVTQLTPDVSVRASLEETMAYAQDADPFTVIIDVRTDNEFNGIARSSSGAASGTYVAFEGHIKTAEHQEYNTLQVGSANKNPLLPKADLIAAMAAINIDEDSTSISYCKTSWRAATTFLALDAVLGWDTKIYDGAWVQWGAMADKNDPLIDGNLETDSPWRTDYAELSESIKYNNSMINIDPEPSAANSSAANANGINETDKAICAAAGTFPNDRSVDVMISPASLMDWVDNGLPDNGASEPYYNDPYTKVVVLHVDYSQANYDAGHVPGAFFMSLADLSTTRDNGIADTISQVATDGMMDDLIQRTGIDADTVVVFTTSPGNYNMMNLGRAYFNFRYWGFPKEMLRILDGNTTTHYAAVDNLSTATPTPVDAGYSVCDLRQDNSVDEVRASFEEMHTVAADSDPLTVVADARSENEYNGVAGSSAGATSGTYVAFEGHVNTALHQEYSTLLSDGKLLPTVDLETAMGAIGASDATTVYTYCKTSWRAAVNFMALDAVLGWPVKIYDGAWVQWGMMATVDYEGALDDTSIWRADTSTYSDPITYNNDVKIDHVGTNSYAPHANLINVEDSATGAAGGGGGGGGGSTPSSPGYP